MRLLLLGKGPLNAVFLWGKKSQSNPIGVLRNIQQILKSFKDPKQQVKKYMLRQQIGRGYVCSSLSWGGSLSVLKIKIGSLLYHCVLPVLYQLVQRSSTSINVE